MTHFFYMSLLGTLFIFHSDDQGSTKDIALFSVFV